MDDDSLIDPYRKLTDAVHGEGAVIFAQLSHAGARSRDSGLERIAPSDSTDRPDDHPKAMDADDIARVIRGFADAAVRAKKAGFDGVQIHSAHGYLLNQFYSPLTNHRTDEYTGSTMEGRTRLHCEVLRAVREAVGADYPVAIRFGACDFLEGGSRIEEIPEAVRYFEAAGADVIDISGGLKGFVRPDNTEPGYFKDMSLAAKSAVSVPVVLTGGVTTGEELEKLLEEGVADMIGVGRALLSDPDWSVKALALT
jgi:2,4-dienoyl-CoA reductase-like NADH-dependent reductase (Old Yellow Enzyme family)